MRRALLSVTLTAVIAALLLALVTVFAVPTSAATCPTGTWGSLPKTAAPMSQAPVLDVRAGQAICWDRVVVDVNGPVGGYNARYVTQVTGIASGLVIPTAGGARLELVVRDPATTRPPLPSVAGFRTLRQVTYAGSFEGLTAFGIGVRARLPFRVFTLPGPGTHSRLVLDVAHVWP